MKILVEGGLHLISVTVPEPVERMLRGLLQQEGDAQGQLTAANLEAIAVPDAADEEYTPVDSLHDMDLLADAKLVTKLVLEGLKRRIAEPVQHGERLRVR